MFVPCSTSAIAPIRQITPDNAEVGGWAWLASMGISCRRAAPAPPSRDPRPSGPDDRPPASALDQHSGRDLCYPPHDGVAVVCGNLLARTT